MSDGRILVVEDSRTQAAVTAGLLRGAGYTVTVVDRAELALQTLARAGVDLVLSDVQMPGMGGYELCRRIRADAKTSHLPVVLLTSLDSPQDVLAGLSSGASNFVSKPVQGDVLLRRIGRLLSSDHGGDGDPGLIGPEVSLRVDREHAVAYLSATLEDHLQTRTAERKAKAEAVDLRRAEAFLSAVLDGVSSCVGIVDGEGRLQATNREWQEFGGKNPPVGPKVPAGSDFLARCHRSAGEHRCARELAAGIPTLLDGSTSEISVECEAHCTENWRCFRVRASRIEAEGPPRVVMSFHDVTELKLAEARLQHEAYHDSLTGLPNRALFLERLDRALARARRREESVAVLFCDVDRFKLVNDSLGHAAGDSLLVEVATRMSSAVRNVDSVSRFGGDEFAILLESYGSESMAFRIAERVLEFVSRPAEVLGQEVFTTLSMGIAIGHPGAEANQLIRDADTAMYRAKEAGKARFVVFDEGMHARALSQLKLQAELRRAVAQEEFFLLYQPIVELGSNLVVGLEALIRWQHPDRGVVSPFEFIPAAEESGQIQAIGLFVLREACAQIARWRADRAERDFPFRVHVNLSGRQLQTAGFVDAVRASLDEHELPASVLEFELTESVVLTSGGHVEAASLALRELGAGLSMDDFGTGFSSLSALRQLPFTTLKLDRSFVGQIDRDPRSLGIVRSLMALGRSMDLEVVAEGVELTSQLTMLEEMDCRLCQGYLFARPLPAAEAGRLLGTALAVTEG